MAGRNTVLQFVIAVFVGFVAWRWYQSSTYLPPVSGGSVHPAYQPVADLFRKLVEDGTLGGGSFAVYHKGKKLVDLWGGYANPTSRLPWKENTLTVVYSSTKGMTALSVAKLVERGLLDYKAEIRKYWPEFAQNGKSNITLEMLMSHQAGLLSFGEERITLDEYKNNWSKVETLMAQATPDFPPGTVVAYHGLTFGMYVDAIIRKVDPHHRNLSQFFADEISKPLDAEFYIGLPVREFYRAALVINPSPWTNPKLIFDPRRWPLVYEMFDPESPLRKMARPMDLLDDPYQSTNNPYAAEVGFGSAYGFGPARSLAKIYDYVANGGTIAGKTLLPKALIEKLTTPLTLATPSAGNLRLDFTVGLHVFNNSQGYSMFGHPGYGGQIAEAVPKYGLGMAYISNFLTGDLALAPDHFWELERLVYDCFKRHQAGLNTQKAPKKKSSENK